MYGINYKKMMDGYNKINTTIESVQTPEQLECIPRMIESWVNLMDKYCDQIYADKANKTRKKDTNVFAESGSGMFNDLVKNYQQKQQEFGPNEYEGVFKPVRVKGLPEISDFIINE